LERRLEFPVLVFPLHHYQAGPNLEAVLAVGSHWTSGNPRIYDLLTDGYGVDHANLEFGTLVQHLSMSKNSNITNREPTKTDSDLNRSLKSSSH
jgi:hypothetical protein